MWASPGSVPLASAWQGDTERLQLVLDASGFERMVADAAAWAERITLCLTAPQSQRGALPWWRELLARSSKCERIYLRRADHSESWLLHRLHETGALRLIESGGKQVAQNLLLFARGDQLRVLLSHISLERAVAGAGFGALLSFQGSGSSELARSCRAQADSWARLACIPSGNEVDWLVLEPKGPKPAPVLGEAPGPLRVVSDAAELEAHIERFSAQGLEGAVLHGGWTLSVRAFDSGFRLQFQHWERSRPPVLLTLHAGSAWAAGNGLMLETPSGEGVLAWRGGLLGTSRSKCELLWSETRLSTVQLADPALSPAQRAALGPAQRVALVARSGEELAPQLTAFVRETCRLGDVFGVEPPPTLGHAVADFTSLSPRQQTLLVWRALIGLGALDFSVATLLALQALRDQGYLRGHGSDPDASLQGSTLLESVAQLLERAAEQGSGFDRPAEGLLRAIQPDISAYVLEDWQECLLLGIPAGSAVGRRQALRLGFERARSHFGLSEPTLVPGGRLERTLESTLQSGLRRGLFTRVGAASVQRPTALAAATAPARRLSPSRAEEGLLAGWWRGLEQLGPTQRFLLTRRSGWYCRRETLDSAAQRLGMPLERAQKLEQEAWRQLEDSSDWGATLRERLQRAFAGTRALPVRLLVAEDPWWQGVDQHTGLAEAVFESLCQRQWHVLELGPPGRRETLIAAFPQRELDQALERLLARAAQLSTPAPLAGYEALPAELASSLEPGLSEWFRDALVARLELDPADPTQVLGFNVEAEATLEHLPEPQGAGSEARLRLEDAVRSAFRSARTPLSLAAIAERIQQRVDVGDEALGVLLAQAPFVQRNADQYGLLARDVPGGPEAIASALDAVVETLAQTLHVLNLRDAVSLVTNKVKQPWSLELVRSLLGSDPALCLSPTLDVRLRRWEHARLVAASELICPGIPAPVRPHFEKLVQAPLLGAEEFSQKLELALSRLERSADADDLHTLALARQLYDVCARLLEHSAQLSARGQQLAQAALSCFIDALEQDEDDTEAPPLDPARLVEARAVLVAVLAELELDWLAIPR
ncbi:MAG: hypothetical protein RL033_3321 [Pseudomonadota bacterium]